MSVRMNGYEQNLKNKLQRDLTRREAENAILEIREALYGDSYTQIHPIYIGHDNDTVSKRWPSVNALVNAYYSGDYDTNGLEDFREEFDEDFEQEVEQKLPNASAIAGFFGYHDIVQNNPHHFGTINEHVDAVVNSLPEYASTHVKVAALLHDIGKYDTITVNQKTGYSQFLKHADKSVELINNNIDALLPLENFSEADRKYITELVRLHDTKYSKQGKCQTMLNEHPNGFARDLITLQYADVMGQSKFNRESKLQEVLKFAELLQQVGTPEQTVGFYDFTPGAIVYRIKDSIRAERQENIRLEKKANTPKVEHITAKTDKETKYTDLSELYAKAEGNLLPTYTNEEANVELQFYARALCIATIDGKEYYPEEEDIPTSVEKSALDRINETEGRTKEPVTIETLPEKKEWLARTSDNKDIYIDSKTLEHMEAHPDVNIAHIREAIGNISIGEKPFLMNSIDMGRTIGKDNCVEISPDTKVENLYRKGRDGMTPIAMDKEPSDTNLLTVGMALDDDGKLTMFTSFYGQLAPKEPWDERLSPEEKAESEQFWKTHALVVPDEAIDWERSDRSPHDLLEEPKVPTGTVNEKQNLSRNDFKNLMNRMEKESHKPTEKSAPVMSRDKGSEIGE